MAESTYHQMSVQHIRRLEQSRSPGPVRLVHQQQQQLLSPGAQHPSAAGLEVHPPVLAQYHQHQPDSATTLERQRA